MPQNPPAGFPRISPMLWYDDPGRAIDWLAQSFGLACRMQMPGPDGRVVHAELGLADGVVMLGPADAARGQASPRKLGAVNQSLYVYVDDVNAHHARARKSGAEIVDGPADMFWGDRVYTALDCEGHRWSFAQKVRDVAPEDPKPPA